MRPLPRPRLAHRMVEGRRRPCPSPRRVLIALTLGETISANLREYPTSQTQSAAGRGRGDEGQRQPPLAPERPREIITDFCVFIIIERAENGGVD